jgi:hypothetical protein
MLGCLRCLVAVHCLACTQAGAQVSETSASDSKKAVERLIFGLPIPAPSSDGTCSPASSTPVRYGMNSTTSCALELTGDQLLTFCK